MLTLSTMVMRLIAAALFGAVIGWERELIGKEAGVRTCILVASGAAMFAMIGLTLPFILMTSGFGEANAGANGAMGAIANIVVGVGFLGAGIIFKDREQNRERVHGLTTAAVVWATAALGALAGIGLVKFAAFATVFLAILLYLLRQFSINSEIKRQPLYVPLPPKRRLAKAKKSL
jgi:putative Mg2+ transporter-C (MgtC) family protein